MGGHGGPDSSGKLSLSLGRYFMNTGD